MHFPVAVLPGPLRLMPALSKQRIAWRPLLLEAFFVVLGVVLALAANEWREYRNHRQHAAQALAGIREELDANRRAVDDALRYHLHLADTLRLFLAQPDGRPPTFSRGFTDPATMLSTAWETANATDAVSYMDYDDVLLLSRTYAGQRSYEQQKQNVGQLIYARLFDEGFQGVYGNLANLQTILMTFAYRECQLLESYAEAFVHLGEPAATADAPAIPAVCQRLLRR